MNCIFCHKGMADGVSLFRINEKGVPGIWACREHRSLSDQKLDAEVDEIVSLIERVTL